jgi:hypothetical protein
MERELTQAKEALERKTEELAQSEARYRWALKAGRLVHWETDLVARTRTWTKEAMARGQSLANGTPAAIRDRAGTSAVMARFFEQGSQAWAASTSSWAIRA